MLANSGFRAKSRPAITFVVIPTRIIIKAFATSKLNLDPINPDIIIQDAKFAITIAMKPAPIPTMKERRVKLISI